MIAHPVCKNVNPKYDPDSRIYLDAVLKLNFRSNSCRILAIRRFFHQINMDLPGFITEGGPNKREPDVYIYPGLGPTFSSRIFVVLRGCDKSF